MKVYLAYVGCAFEGHDEEVVGAVFELLVLFLILNEKLLIM